MAGIVVTKYLRGKRSAYTRCKNKIVQIMWIEVIYYYYSNKVEPLKSFEADRAKLLIFRRRELNAVQAIL